MQARSRYFLPVVFLFVCNSTFCAHNYYVGTKGDDRSEGRSVQKPLRTFKTAIEKALPGDTIYFLPGTYHEKMVLRKRNGMPEKYIYIAGYDAHNKPEFDGGAPVPAMDLENNWLEMEGCSWIRFSDLSFKNGWTDPVRVTQSSFISFINCDFKGGRKVILCTGAETHHILVEGCSWDQGGEALWKLDKDVRGVDAWLSMHHELMGYYNGSLVDSRATGGSFVVRGNHIRNAYNGIRFTSKKGYDANSEIYNNDLTNIRDNDFEPEHYAFNLHIYHNRSHNIHKTFSVDDVAGGYIYYYGNTISMDSDDWSKKICSGFNKIYGGTDSLTYPLYIFNNSFFGYGKNFNAMEKKARQLKHFNNAYQFAGQDGWVLKYVDSTNSFDNDVSNRPWPSSLVEKKQETHGTIAEARFLNPGLDDLRVSPNSPVVDAGRVMQFPELGWVQSFAGIAPDAGAYENSRLVEGPPFRFRLPENAAFSYRETPRMVRYAVSDNSITIWFSSPLDGSTVHAASIRLANDGNNIKIAGAAVSAGGYELVLHTHSPLHADAPAIAFTVMPRGVNGMPVTYWASVLPVLPDAAKKQ